MNKQKDNEVKPLVLKPKKWCKWCCGRRQMRLVVQINPDRTILTECICMFRARRNAMRRGWGNRGEVV